MKLIETKEGWLNSKCYYSVSLYKLSPWDRFVAWLRRLWRRMVADV